MKRKATPIDDSIRRMTVPFEVKSSTPDESGQFAGEISGYAAGIHNIDRAGDMILPGAFTDTIADFLKDGVICWQHDWATPIGKPTAAYEDSYGLFSKARISKTRAGEDCMTLIRDGVVNKLSIGYRVKDYQWVDRAGLVAYLTGAKLPAMKQADILRQYDEADLDELFLLKKISLFEYSPVTIPANPNASITAAKGLPFADHSQAVLTAVRELSERMKSIHALRQSQGKAANPSHVDQCHSLADQCEMMCGHLRQMAAEMCAPAPADEGKAAERVVESLNPASIYAQFLKLEARQLGAA
jgi:HK97 family phage prohead protease